MRELARLPIDTLERAMLQMPQTPCPVIHRFGPGIYIREVSIPKDTFAVGHHQNFEQMNIMLKGRVTVLNDDGSTSDLRAPMIFVGQPGRKIGYVHEDMVWLNIYATKEQNVDKLEAQYLTKSFQWKESQAVDDSVKRLKSNLDLLDYSAMLQEIDMNESVVRAQSENADDQTILPHGGYKIKVAKSQIEGEGLFATADILPGEVIAPARITGLRTIAGRYTNHSPMPNAQMTHAHGGDIDLVALSPITGCHGGLDGEEITVNYRESLKLNLKIGGVLCQV